MDKFKVLYGCTYIEYDFNEMKTARVEYRKGVNYQLDFKRRIAVEEHRTCKRVLGFDKFEDMTVIGDDKLPSVIVDFVNEKFLTRIEN